MKNTYNGWKNYETWLIVVNLENDYNFYSEVTTKKEKWTNFEDFKNKYGCYMVDRVNWSKVSAKEIKEWYNEMIK